ncbi:MAG: hypothetical protein MUF18_13100 [Fimbriiglobus sp.]|jgi:hypothetical protein|nr:hypothetical protein [Fimbriiglobus sp.]
MTALRPALAVAGGLLLSSLAVAQPLPAPDPFGPVSPAVVPASPAARNDSVKLAVEAFRQAKDGQPAKYATARDLFARAVREKATLSADQSAAWAYCRVRCATDRLNATADATTAGEVVVEIEDALAGVPAQAALHTAAADVLAAARKRAGTAAKPRPIAETPPAVPTSADATDSPSFVVKFQPRQARTAQEVLTAAEKARAAVFTRWSGPTGTDWAPKCEIVLHPTAEAFAAATGLPASASGRAEVTLSNGRVASRRIDLRADDETLIENALPREIAHVVLTDLFPSKPPPAWAGLAMGVLGASEQEVERYRRTAEKYGQAGQLPTPTEVLTAEAVPTGDVTGFHAQSVAVADFLVRWKGAKMFTAFVRDGLRYGPEAALKRQYGLADGRELEQAMRKGR